MSAADLPNLDSLWTFDDPAASEVRFRDVLAASPAGEPGWTVEAMSQLARSLGLQRKFDQAGEVLDAAEVRLGNDARPRPRIRILLERGRVLNSSGHPADARPLFVEAWERARAGGEDGLAVDAAHMVAIAEEGPGVTEWNLKAMELAESSTDPKARSWRASLLNNMGWTLHDEKRYDEALALFERALAAREEQGVAQNIRIARWCIARCVRSLGRLEEALARQESLRVEAEAAKAPDGFIEEELAECKLALGREEEARPHFARAWEVLSKDPWLAANEPARLERLRSLAAGPAN